MATLLAALAARNLLKAVATERARQASSIRVVYHQRGSPTMPEPPIDALTPPFEDTVLETSLRGAFEVCLINGGRLKWPRAKMLTHYITLGLSEQLDEAARLAVGEMVECLMAGKQLSREDAYMLCSLAADLHVTQAVDATKGVHVTKAKSRFNR
jgi:hypothetical protein